MSSKNYKDKYTIFSEICKDSQKKISYQSMSKIYKVSDAAKTMVSVF